MRIIKRCVWVVLLILNTTPFISKGYALSPTPYAQLNEPCFPINNITSVYPEGASEGCTNIQDAINNAAPDGIIHIHDGEYNFQSQTIVVNKNVDIQGNNRRLTEGPPIGSFPKLSFNNSVYAIQIKDGASVTLRNLVFNSSGQTIYAQNVGRISLMNNYFYGEGPAIGIYNFLEANLHGNGFIGSSQPIEIQHGQLARINHNKIINSSRGIILHDAETEIIGNLIINSGIQNASVYAHQVPRLLLNHNTIIQDHESNYEFAIDVGEESQSIEVEYNIVKGEFFGLRIASASATPRIKNNNFYNQKGNYVGISDQTGLEGNISADPLFNDKYCLSPSSPSLLPGNEYMGSEGPCVSPSPIDELISRILINPGQLTTTVGAEKILFSAQAMKLGEGDVEDATYEWGMSSDNSIGTLFSDPSNQKQAWFTPVRAGRGDIWVTVRIGDYHKTASVPVVVNKLCQERNSCTSDACIQIVPPGGWCASEALPGDVDFNNTVDYQDIIKFKAAFDKKFYPADFNFDGKVNIYDFLMLVKHFGLSLDILDVAKEPISESGGTN